MGAELRNLNQLETAVLMEKYAMILGMINYGTAAQKQRAKKELEILDEQIHHHLNAHAFLAAQRKLNLTEEDLEFIAAT